jgi:hypothetical protein
MPPDQVPSPDGAAAEVTDSMPPQPRTRIRTRGLAVAALAVVLLWAGTQAASLWREWQALRQEIEHASSNAVVGYPNIFPRPSLAAKPADWYRPEGKAILLWAGWDEGVGHHWFRLNPGELDRDHVSGPIGRDVIPAIVNPWIETGGGQVWQRIPATAPVVGQTLEGLPCVYPIPVLRKVFVINDVINDHPYLVVYTPGRPAETSVAIFDSSVGGGRVILGTAGYLMDGKPLLYDKATESLWVEDGEILTAISGRYKGSRLPLVCRPVPVAWSDWKSHNPRSRLLIGARERSAD